MADTSASAQVLTRLIPLAAAFTAIDKVTPVTARAVVLADAVDRVLAADVVAVVAQPKMAIALADGFSVRAEATLDASSYAPVLLPGARPANAGMPMPDDADAILRFDGVQMNGGRVLATEAVAPGDGVLRAGDDCLAGAVLRQAGEWMRESDAAAFAIAGIQHVQVRSPIVAVACAREGDTVLDAIATMLAAKIGAKLVRPGEALGSAADLAIVVGGTGSGRNDTSIEAVARQGHVAFHGVGLYPGETSALGFIAGAPVLLLPGRLDAALAAWLVLGRRLLARLSGDPAGRGARPSKLLGKIASTVGVADFVPVRRNAEGAQPLGTRLLPLARLTRANGFVLVSPESEGYPAGAAVTVEPWL